MKLKHNKKRNTAFLYETLMRELTKSILSKDANNKRSLIKIIKEHFGKDSILIKELRLYKTLYETCGVEPYVAEKLIQEVKKHRGQLNSQKLFQEQSALIKKMSKVSKSVFSNFVPNYKSLATIYQIFDEDSPIKEKVLLEQSVLKNLIRKRNKDTQQKPIDNLVYKSFVKKFNEKYEGKLLQEQKELLNKYISSFLDNGIELKIYLNEEIGRLRDIVAESLDLKEVQEDLEMVQKTKQVLKLVEGFKNEKVNKNIVEQVLKIQQLVKEIKTDAN